MLSLFVNNHVVLVTIVIFLFLFSLIIITKPGFIFNKNGSLKDFGLGYKNKTVLPVWLVIIILAILSYFFVLYYLNSKKTYNF
jgi:hypothetical protein